MAERRARGAEAAAAAAAAVEYGEKKVTLEMLRGQCSGRYAAPEEDVKTLYAFFDEKGLSTVDQVRDHHGRLYDRVRDYVDDHEVGFKKLIQVLVSTSKLAGYLASINNELFVAVPGASRDELRASTLRQALDVCTMVCEQYKAEEKDRNSSNYDRALETLKGAQELSLDDKSQWKARGKLYEDEGVLASCVCLREFNGTVLGGSFNSSLHLPAGAQDLSSGDYTPHLAAEPGAASRLALSKIGDAPDLLDANIEMMWFCYCWMSMALLESYYIAKCCYLVFGSYLQGPLVMGELGAVYAVIALGTQFVVMNPQELAAFKERVEGERKLWGPVGRIDNVRNFQVLEFVSDKGDTVVCVKKDRGEGSSVDEWRASTFLGGQQLDPEGTVPDNSSLGASPFQGLNGGPKNTIPPVISNKVPNIAMAAKICSNISLVWRTIGAGFRVEMKSSASPWPRSVELFWLRFVWATTRTSAPSAGAPSGGGMVWLQ